MKEVLDSIDIYIKASLRKSNWIYTLVSLWAITIYYISNFNSVSAIISNSNISHKYMNAHIYVASFLNCKCDPVGVCVWSNLNVDKWSFPWHRCIMKGTCLFSRLISKHPVEARFFPFLTSLLSKSIHYYSHISKVKAVLQRSFPFASVSCDIRRGMFRFLSLTCFIL